jgi:predicted lipid-binding transport protein (Tim44 family)
MHNVVTVLGAVFIGTQTILVPLSPSPTNPLCYNSQTYRDTHEQECLIDNVHAGPSKGHGGGGGGFLGGLLGGLGLGGL